MQEKPGGDFHITLGRCSVLILAYVMDVQANNRGGETFVTSKARRYS
jgi:alcohol dehydrogenase class IV